MKHISLALVAFAGAAHADAPTVAADIAPLHSLVSQVMQGVGEPALIVDPGASPHGYRLRPSSAATLQEADVIFWVGEGLTPWLGNALDNLAADAVKMSLMEAEGLPLLETRENAVFGDDDHHDSRDEHGHDEDHAEDEHGHNDHADEGNHEDPHHGHGTHDPHAWLSPRIAGIWLGTIAETLAQNDPAHAEIYRKNASEAQVALDNLISTASAEMAPLRGKGFVVFHDAYQYFEVDFEIPSVGAVLISDASEPSPGRIIELQDTIRSLGVTCALAEPQFNPDLLATVMEGSEIKTGIIDPLGATLTLGPDLYPALIENMVDSLQDCLS